MTVLRYGWIYHLIGLTLVLVAAAFPVLMWLTHEEIDAARCHHYSANEPFLISPAGS